MTGQIEHSAGVFSDQIPSLVVVAERVAASVLQGTHGRRKPGQGDSFWQFRPYGADDDRGRIDWRQSGKHEGLFVREKEWEAAQTLWIWRDNNPRLDYRSSDKIPTKQYMVDVLSLALTILLVRGEENVGLMGTGIKPAHHMHQVTKVGQYMQKYEASNGASLPDVHADRIAPHSEMVFIGDFLEKTEDIYAALRPFADQGLRGTVIQILDPAEIDFPFSGRVRFHDVEQTQNYVVENAGAMKRAYQQKMQNHIQAITEMARQWGWHFMPCRTDQKPQAVLLDLHNHLSDRGR